MSSESESDTKSEQDKKSVENGEVKNGDDKNIDDEKTDTVKEKKTRGRKKGQVAKKNGKGVKSSAVDEEVNENSKTDDEAAESVESAPSVETKKKPAPKKVNGLKLGDIPAIEIALNRFRTEDLKLLHQIIYDEPGNLKQIKKSVKRFKGFDYAKNSDEYKKKLKEMSDDLDSRQLKSVCEMLDLNRKSNDVTELATIILDFLVEPSDLSAKVVTMSSGGRPQRSTKTKASYSSADDDDDDVNVSKKSIYRDYSDSFDDSESEPDSEDGKKRSRKKSTVAAKRTPRAATKRKQPVRAGGTRGRGRGRPPKSKKYESSTGESADSNVGDKDSSDYEEPEEKKPVARTGRRGAVAKVTKPVENNTRGSRVAKKKAIEAVAEKDEEDDDDDDEDNEEDKENESVSKESVENEDEDEDEEDDGKEKDDGVSNEANGDEEVDEEAADKDKDDENDKKKKTATTESSLGKRVANNKQDSEANSDEEPLAKKTKKGPSDEEIKKYLESILNGANLENITMKNVCSDVYEHWKGHDLIKRRDFIKETVKSLISVDESD
uniref:DEK-C domain-containing protein n=1 Tax=Cuerna arida TaxID=1464854 RepID=A0A1B6FWA8_9HEMI